MTTSHNPDRNRDILCHCSGTTRRQITDLIDGGIDHPANISRMTGAGAGCGACETAILDLLSEYPQSAANPGG
jgi:bacterioferritin-associated ferredoxin